MMVLQYQPGIKVTNVESLPKCKMARYLEVVVPHDLELPLIAAAWHRKMPQSLQPGRALIEFSPR